MRLYILKAAQVLLTQQDNLRQILSQPVTPDLRVGGPPEGGEEDGALMDGVAGQGILMQQLMQTATQPSPLKAMFHREEMEVSYS